MEEYKRTKERTRPVRRTDYRRRLPRDTKELEQEQRLLFQAAVSFLLVVITLGLVFIKTDFTKSFREKLKVGIAEQVSLEELRQNNYIDHMIAKAEGLFSGLFPEKGEEQGTKSKAEEEGQDKKAATQKENDGGKQAAQAEQTDPVNQQTTKSGANVEEEQGTKDGKEDKESINAEGKPNTVSKIRDRAINVEGKNQ